MSTGTHKARLLAAKELAELLSISIRSVWRFKAEEKIPKPLAISGCIRWRLSDVERWIEEDCPQNLKYSQRRLKNVKSTKK